MGWDGGNLFILAADGCIVNEVTIPMNSDFSAASIFSLYADFVVQKEGAPPSPP